MTTTFVPDAPPAISTSINPKVEFDLDFALLWSKTVKQTSGVYWWATHTPRGAALTAFRPSGAELKVDSWGPGSAWAVQQLPALIGLRDTTVDEFRPDHPVLRPLAGRFNALRIGATGRWYEALVTTAIGQRVVTADAAASRTRLAAEFGDRSLGGPMGVLPTPDRLLRLRDHDFHRVGIERSRARVLRIAARYADRLERLADLSGNDAVTWMQRLPGVGPWTSSLTSAIAGGNPDAVPEGDLHVPGMVTYAFTGEQGGDDQMLEVLEPFAGHRGRVVRMVKMGGAGPAKHRPAPSRYDIRGL